MGRSVNLLAVLQARCAEKTARGNSYARLRQAQEVAEDVRRRTGDPVEAFACDFCGRYHVGKRTPRRRR